MFLYPIVIALVLDFSLGDPAWPWHPVRLLGHLIDRLEAVCRGLPLDEREQGFVFLFFNLVAVLLPMALLLAFLREYPWTHHIVSGILIYFALGGTCLAREVARVSEALARGGIEAGRRGVAMLVSRDTDAMEAEDIVSSAIETLAENFSDSAVATLLYAALGGPLLAWTHRVANTLDAMVGYTTPEYLAFGYASAKFDDVAGFLPARISALLIAAAAPSVAASPLEALSCARLDGRALPSPNSGYPIAAFAGALRVKLCGPTSYFGEWKDKPYIGHGERPAAMDLCRSLALYWNAYAAAAACALLLAGALLR